MDEFSFKEMKTWGQSKISTFCICESGELGRRRISIFPCVTSGVETFSSGTVTFRIRSNINDEALLWKQSTALTRRLFPQNRSTTDQRPDSKCGSDWRHCEFGVRVDCKCMEFVAAGWCTKKWLRFDQTIRYLTSGDADCCGEIPNCKGSSSPASFHE